MAYKLPELGYALDALEPHIDARTMEIHLTKHHQAYVDNINNALAGNPELAAQPIEKVLTDLARVPEAIRTAVRNHGGGHANHTLFWSIMGPHGGGEPTGDLAKAIAGSFGSFAAFKEQLTKAGMGRFGSGWSWLAFDAGKLIVESSANQDTPLSEGRTPLLTVDVWEHAYYLKYQNRRADYLTAWWNTVNWSAVADRYAAALGK
jgi:superoxide dismutase, Fe-Mn family